MDQTRQRGSEPCLGHIFGAHTVRAAQTNLSILYPSERITPDSGISGIFNGSDTWRRTALEDRGILIVAAFAWEFESH